jgi:hypothetical protein
MVAADRGQTSAGKASGPGRNAAWPAISGECNGCEDDATKGNAQEIKAEPTAGLCDLDEIGGRAKPDQYGRRVCCRGYGAAWASSRQAFLRQACCVLGVMEYWQGAPQQNTACKLIF